MFILDSLAASPISAPAVLTFSSLKSYNVRIWTFVGTAWWSSRTQLQFLVRELRSCKLQGSPQNKTRIWTFEGQPSCFSCTRCNNYQLEWRITSPLLYHSTLGTADSHIPSWPGPLPPGLGSGLAIGGPPGPHCSCTFKSRPWPPSQVVPSRYPTRVPVTACFRATRAHIWGKWVTQ